MAPDNAPYEHLCDRRHFLSRLLPMVPALAAAAAALRTPPAAGAETPQGRPKVDAARCVGCGRCARIAKSTFAIDPRTKKAYVKNATGDTDALIRKAAARCRKKAISIG